METRVYSDLALHGALVMSKNETGFPANPALGTMVIKDYCLYAYIKLGSMETWFPFSKATNSYIHVQSSASMTWTVQHNLGTTDIWYQVTGPTGNIIIVGKTDIDENSFQLDFTSAVVGRCVVVAPDTINVPEVKASIINVANSSVIIDSSGVLINGSYALTSSNIDAQINGAVATEQTRAQLAEATLTSHLNAEITRASNAESTLTSNILAEQTRASNAEATLAANILVEKTRASAAEATLTANLNTEITRATAAESTLNAAILSEATRASNAEATLAANILVEKTRAMNAESTLTSALSNKQPLDNDLTAIAGLSGTSGLLRKTATDTWTLDTSTYITSVNSDVSIAGSISVPTGTIMTGSLTTSTTTANQVVHSLSTTVYRTIQYTVQMHYNTSFQSTQIMIVHDGVNAYMTEYSSVSSNGSLATFDADINSGNIRLLVTPVNATTEIKVIATGIYV